jgi:hypothetical protein
MKRSLVQGGLLMTILDCGARAAGPSLQTSSSSPAATPASGFFEALRSEGPREDRKGARDLYGGLIGSWDAEVVDHLADGTDRRQSAEIHFAWVLEGRAVQDLWIAPARRERQVTSPPSPGNRYGTTLRVYDPAIDAWRVTWVNPVTGAENHLIGHREGSRIVQMGTDATGRPIRWTFVEILPDSFHWRGERSEDGGRSWICDTEFFAHRRDPSSVSPLTETSRERHASWEWTDRPGLETASIIPSDSGVAARGRVLVVLEGAPLRASYAIEHDARWRFREARVETGPIGDRRELHIRRLPEGRFEVDGAPRPDLDGCEDIDLMVSPYTNTPPLAARSLAPGESRRLRVAWVRFPELEVHAVEQEYTRLDGTDPERYRYRNLESGLISELTLGADGLVLEYGPWRRR